MNKFNRVFIGFSVAAMLMGSASAFGETQGMKNGALDATALTCMQAAVDSRDTAIIAAWDAQYPAVKTALQTRQTALMGAWGQANQKTRRDATRAAWDAYKGSVKSARATMKASHKATWTKFEADRKACSPKATKDDNGSLGMDSQL